MEEASVAPRICRVCCARSDSAHFGVDSCRACAAFFRRTVSLGKRYVCRQSKFQCRVHKDVSFMCRRCRYEKCLSAGMRPQSVNSKSASHRNSTDSEDKSPPERGLLHKRKIKQELPETDIEHSPSDINYLLPRISKEYYEDLRRRIAIERQVMRLPLQNRYDLLFPSIEELLPATAQNLNAIAVAVKDSYIKFAIDCYGEDFILLTGDEQAIAYLPKLVVQNYVLSCFSFENIYRTLQRFGGRSDIFLVANTIYVKFDAFEDFFSEMNLDGREDKAKVMRDSIRNGIFDVLSPCMKKTSLHETEFIAILGLLFWSPCLFLALSSLMINISDIPKASNRCTQNMLRNRARIYRELQNYYRQEQPEMNLPERLAHLTTILMLVQGAATQLRSDMAMFMVMEIFDSQSEVYQLTGT